MRNQIFTPKSKKIVCYKAFAIKRRTNILSGKLIKTFNNRTFLAKNHKRLDHFRERDLKAREVQNNLSDYLFRPDFIRNELASGETNTLDIKKPFVLQVALEKDLEARDRLIEFKCALAISKVMQDTVRLRGGIQQVHLNLVKPNANALVFNTATVQLHARKLLLNSRRVKIFIGWCLHVFTKQEKRVI